MIKLTGYFDASGGAEHSYVIVAGYVSTVARWKRFDREWWKVLRRKEFDVPYFHMKEFAHSVGAFSGWKDDEHRRRRFLGALIGVIAKYTTIAVGCGIKKSTWNEVNREYPLSEQYGCPYALCGRDCVNKVFVWGRQKGWKDGEIGTVFEAGDKGKGHLIRVVEEAHKPVPAFEHGRPNETNDSLGVARLQASDFAAWELLKAVSPQGEPASLARARVSLQKLSRAVPVSWTQYKTEDFLALLAVGGIAKRMAPPSR